MISQDDCVVSTGLNGELMSRRTVDPEEYVERFCAETGARTTIRDRALLETGLIKKKVKRRLFLRMYKYNGGRFVIRAYDRILCRYPDQSEIEFAQIERQFSRTWLMLALRFGEEGRLMRSCNVVGLSVLRIFWNATHRRGRRVALPKLGE